MNYLDNSQKFISVLNANVPVPMLMNALGHTTAGLAAHLEPQSVTYLDYVNDVDGFVAKIAQPPFVILKAKNSAQLSALRAAAAAEGIACNVFVSAMIGKSAKEQVASTRAASGDGLEYWVVTLFGDAERLQPITKRFSLFSISAISASTDVV